MLIKKGKRGEKSIWECDICGKKFEMTNSRVSDYLRNNLKGFCSKQCRTEHWKKNASKRLIDWVKENGSSQFKGGIGITTDGYIWIRIRNKGYYHDQIKLHRYLMEVKLGRRLNKDEIVHHKNGDKFDNDIDNLEIVSRSEHNKIHSFFSKNRDDLFTDEELKDLLSDMSVKELHKKYPHRTIGSIHQKRYRLKHKRG